MSVEKSNKLSRVAEPAAHGVNAEYTPTTNPITSNSFAISIYYRILILYCSKNIEISFKKDSIEKYQLQIFYGRQKKVRF